MDDTMQPDLWSLYRQMVYSRRFEQAVARLWQEGLISGEMHLGMGEEAIVAGVLAHLQDKDAMALDHRGTPPLLMRGVDPILLLREFLGRADGLCAGMGGHMHLFAPQYLAASSGIVGASGPAGAGLALSAQMLRPGTIAVAFFGEGAMNQGMLMEAMNLAAVWKLPALFVCKDDGWAITTQSASVTAGNLSERARGLGLHAKTVDGSDVTAVWLAAREAVEHVRSQQGPVFLHAYCTHLEGHFLGDQLVRVARRPVREMSQITGPLLKSMARKTGARAPVRADALAFILLSIKKAIQRQSTTGDDPIQRTRQALISQEARLFELEQQIEHEIEHVVSSALAGPEPGEEVNQ